MRPRITTTLQLLVLLAAAAFADEKSDQVDKLFERWDQAGSPGAAVAIVRDGEVVYARGYGEANLEHGVPITPGSVFYLGSVSKQFVAFCIALLEQDGKLSVEDDVRKYVPELSDYGTTITVAHLVHHTSGVRDYLELMSLAGLPLGTFHDDAGVIELIARQKGLNFTPGERYLYSNSGYFLLNVIVERVSGKTLKEFAHERIFEPLGMENTHFHDDYTHVIPHRASGYLPWRRKTFRHFLTTFDRVGSGGVFSSVEDLVLWDRNFEDPKVGGDVLDRIHTVGRLNGGREIEYAFGLVVSSHRGLPTVGHGGALGGYRSALVRFPEQRFSVIILANVSGMNPSFLANEIAAVYLADVMEDEAPNTPRETPSDSTAGSPGDRWEPMAMDELEACAGDYFSDELGVTYRLSAGKPGLTPMIVERRELRQPLRPRGSDVFRAPWGEVKLVRGADGAVTGFVLDTGRAGGIVFERRP